MDVYSEQKKIQVAHSNQDGAPDFASFLTCFTTIKRNLLYLDGSLMNYLKICVPLFFLTTGTVTFVMTVAVHFDDRNTVWLVENGHWFILYIAVIFWDMQIGYYSPIILEMNQAVKSGVYRYQKYETVNTISLEKTNALVSKINRIFSSLVIIGVGTTLIKATILEEHYPYRHLFSGWFPFEINSVWRLTIVIIYELGGVWAAATGSHIFFMTTMAYSYHVEAHLRLLMQKVEKVLEHDESSGYNNSAQEAEKKIKECLEHHRMILRLFNHLSTFCNPTVGFSTLISTCMVCTLLYLMTNPDFDMNVYFSFSGLVAPELGLLLSIRIRGQQITDLSKEVNQKIYELNWEDQDLKLKKNLLMWLRLTSKPLELKAFGYRNVSHEGVKDVLQATYTFFNMLKAST